MMFQTQDIHVKEGDSFVKSIQAFDERGNPVHWGDLVNVEIAVKDIFGDILAYFALGQELTVNNDDDTQLIMTKLPGQNEVRVGKHRFDIKLSFNQKIVKHTRPANYICYSSITK